MDKILSASGTENEFNKSSSMKKNLYINIKRYGETRKLTIGQCEDYTTGRLLDYDYIKHHDRLLAAGLSRQKELNAESKAIQQIEFVRQLKKLDDDDSNATDND